MDLLARKDLRLGVLVSGGGSNLQAIMDSIAAGDLDAEVVVVISDKPGVKALERADKAGIPAVFIDKGAYPDASQFNYAILNTLRENQVELVVMAGYLSLLGPEVLRHYEYGVINLHPALLPAFSGTIHAIQEQYDHGVKVGGVTVHFANEAFDEGPIIDQMAVLVGEDESLEVFEERIHAAEHELLPDVIGMIVEGNISVEGRKVTIW